MPDDLDDSLSRTLAGPRGVYVAVAVCGILAILAQKAHFRDTERAFRERAEALPSRPTPRYGPSAEAPALPQPTVHPADTDATGPSGLAEDTRRPGATLRGLGRDTEEGAGR